LINELKKEELKSEQKYQHLVENSLQGIVIIQNFKIVYSNPAFARILGYTINELLIMRPEEFIKLIHPDDVKMIWDNFKKRLAGYDIPPHYKFKGLTKDGKMKMLDLYASIIDYEGSPATLGLILDVSEQYEAEEKLKQRTKLIETILNNISLGIAVKEINTGKYFFINKELKDILELSEDETPDFDRLLGKVKAKNNKNITLALKPNENFKKPEELIWEYLEIKTKPGVKKYITAKKLPLYDQNLLIFTVQDVTEQLKAEEFLKNSLVEKEILLREVHHRVKNNLQTISSLLDLQAESISEQKILEAFRSSQSRIKSMALIHERLYKAEDLSKIKAEEYIEKLIDYLEDTYTSPSWDIEITIDIKDLFLNLDVAIPCGLIINELVSNSIKYAFPDNRKGRINISLRADESKNLILTISDNGTGIPLEMLIQDSQTLGLQLVKLLVKQLNGKMEIDGANGTTIKIIFPKPITNENVEVRKKLAENEY
jgi:PAS domain S-box-containing protein